MSCGQIALNREGIKIDNYFASEIKPHAIKVTQYNYPGTIQLGDVRNVKGSELPKIDLLIGGSPCQDFSQANKNKLGLLGDKSSLFYEYLRLLKETKPKYFLLENVEMEDKEYAKISELLGTFPVKINSDLVSPQLRERVYWTNIGPEFYDLTGFRHCDISQPKDKKMRFKEVLENGYTDRKKARCLLEGDSRPNSTPVKMFHRYYASGFTTIIFKSKRHYEDCVKYYEENYKNLSADEIKCNSNVFDGLRYMTQNELEQCQTVPKGYTSIVSRNEAASLLGDGWTVDVIAHIFKHIKEGKQ
jgi:DNA (cytosine-5)-methyltransferase 3A